MKIPSAIGRNHVLEVSQALKDEIIGISSNIYSESVIQTANFIHSTYPNIEHFVNKFETAYPDSQPDLLVTLEGNQKIKINLFLIKGSGSIQPKNLGAKSFLEKYFNSPGLQLYFNDYLNDVYKDFLKELIEIKDKSKMYDNIRIMKKTVNNYYPKFTSEINKYRNSFLFYIREKCFDLLKDEYNTNSLRIQNAFQGLMLIDSTNIITRYTEKNKCSSVEIWKADVFDEDNIFVYKKGNNTVGIRSGQQALTLRFKFESGPTSSIKIATSYEIFPAANDVVTKNEATIYNFESVIKKHKQTETKNTSNAIGKCNEAMVYYSLLKKNPVLNQVEDQDYIRMIERYSPIITNENLNKIFIASDVTTEKIREYLEKKYKVFTLESIQLVPESYIENRLDTSDLKLIIRLEKNIISESFSLKAISKSGGKLTTKNPGIGKILGPQYFDIGSLSPIVDKTKEQFNNGLVNHNQSLENVSRELGKSLKKASQVSLKKGVLALIGDCTMVITMYGQNDSIVLEHNRIIGDINVLINTPSLKQTTLRWNETLENLSLRVKFSSSQAKGWSSLKLACEYSI